MRNWSSFFKGLTGAGFILLGLVVFLTGQQDETLKIMPFVADSRVCQPCHATPESQAFLKTPARSCGVYCQTCHKKMTNHHSIGVVIEKSKLPAYLTLSSKDKLTCTSCHDLAGKRFDDKPWKSDSLYGSLFRRATQYKTYFLKIRNNKGQLCRECH
jgi:hypothetical protein